MQRVARLIARNPRSLQLRAASHATSETPSTSSIATTKMESLLTGDIPVEKRSLTRGLAMNKFEKDFMIYPEYTETDDLRNIEGFVKILQETLERTVDERALEKAGELSPEVLNALRASEIAGCFIPKDYGGLGLTYKDFMKINEELSIDWSVATHTTVSHMVSSLILLYGTEAQKEKYLPAIASGKVRPAITLPVGIGSLTSSAEVHGTSVTGLDGTLMAENVQAYGADKANLLLAFAYVKDASKELNLRCFIIDRPQMKEGEKWETKRDETLGLKAVDVSRVTLTATVTEQSVLGDNGKDVASEALSCTRMPLSAAAVGYGKRVLEDIARIANETESLITPGVTLSAHSHIHRTVSQLSLQLYALESVCYYLAGLLDEKLPVVVDVESALLHRLTRAFLRSTTTALLEILGTRAVDSRELFEKRIRDVATLMAMFDESDTVEQVALATMSTWTSRMGKQSKGYSTLRRLLGAEKTMADLRDPKLQHFIAEHAHPSLQLACQELEHSMVRLDAVLSKLLSTDGKQVQADYQSLERLVHVLENNLVMVCTIARASRSYSVGLRNADAELAWTTWLATERSRESWLHLNELSDCFGLIRLNSSLLKSGRSVLEWGGYRIESPVERNW
ncbi:acdh-13 [Pristionchus pacificus]|uniref:Acdh-13 n=1 Tax=Pristionchus pacificus TaxID=54126 RepID=A0A2A6BXK5_PRIPA|nr:acdh-13 [Pristionchus pacificus]|eukprot:PDM70491.1 acdh-13 [Pristionchus pacificus]